MTLRMIFYCVTQFFFGRVTAAEKVRRTLIGSTTGVNAYPNMLPDSVVKASLDLLEDKWQIIGLTEEEVDWRQYIIKRQIKKEYVPFIYTLALYSHHRNPGQESKRLLDMTEEFVDKYYPQI